eukprot:6463575-Amphidinium_carterae.3
MVAHWWGWGAKNLELAAKPSPRLAAPASFSPKQKPSSKPTHSEEEWNVWTGPQGWQDWSKREEAIEAARDDAASYGRHCKPRPTSHVWSHGRTRLGLAPDLALTKHPCPRQQVRKEKTSRPRCRGAPRRQD